jgi:hypothetical protein
MRSGNLEAKIDIFGIGKGATFATIPDEGVEMDLFRNQGNLTSLRFKIG